MTAEERQAILQQSQYSGTATIGRSMFTSGIVNPMIDSAVIASAAKDTGLSFVSAVNNGGIYENMTVMGGNFIFGSSPLDDIIPGLKKFKASRTEGSSIFKFGNFSMNYLPEAALEASGVTKETMGSIGIKNADHVIETGIGFSRNYSNFFNTLKDQGFLANPNFTSREGAVRVLEGSGRYSDVQIASMRKGFKGSDVYIKDELAKYLEAKGTNKTFATDAEKTKYFKDEAAALFKDKNMQNEILVSRAATGKNMTQKMFNDHVSSLDYKGVRQLADDLQGITGKKIASGSAKVVDYYATRVNIIDDLIKSGDGRKIVSYLSKNEKQEIAAALGYSRKSAGKFYDSLKRGKITVDDAFRTAFNNLDSVKAVRSTLETATKTATKEAAEEVSKVAGKHFFEKTAFQTFMSSTPMKVLSGNLVSGAFAMPLAAVTGTLSALSSSHQTAAINNVARLVNYSSDPVEVMRSEDGQAATYGHKRLSYSNSEDLGYIMSTRNVAEKYMRQIDEIEIDAKESSLSNFTTF